VAAAVLLALALNLAWAWWAASGGGDLAAQYAWMRFARDHPEAAYALSWYGGVHPVSYSVLAPYLMAAVGVRTAAVVAGAASAGLLARLLVRSGIRRPVVPASWGALALSCNVASGRVTFAVGVFFGLAALALVTPVPGPPLRSPQACAATALGLLAALTSPVAGLLLEVAAAGLFLAGHRRRALMTGLGPPLVVLASVLLFPFTGVQPMNVISLLVPAGAAVALAVLAPRRWRILRAGAWVYAAGVAATWALPSPLGSNVERLALLFGGTLLLAAAAQQGGRKAVALYTAFAVVAVWQLAKPVGDLAVTAPVPSWAARSGPVIAELQRLHADRVRIEAVPTRSHREASILAPYVNLARGWNRQVDADRSALFYDATLTARSYHAWLQHWAVRYVAVAASDPDGAAEQEARLVRDGQPWLRHIWTDGNWELYEVTDSVPLADPPATVERAGPADILLDVPARGSVTVRISWSPWLAVDGPDGACLAPDGDWTRLSVPHPGVYRIGASYRLPRQDVGCP